MKLLTYYSSSKLCNLNLQCLGLQMGELLAELSCEGCFEVKM